ncbi:putative Multiple myeloma tumor-associated protein 2-like N-terminal domain-containing protein [Seiridium cardinale]
MDLVSSIRKSGSRGGVNFSWDEVASSAHRENYLGHSLKAPVGRWQKGRDLEWYAKNNDADSGPSDETAEERAARERKEEIKRVKEAEEDALARALGLPVKQRNQTGANAVEVAKPRVGPQEGPSDLDGTRTRKNGIGGDTEAAVAVVTETGAATDHRGGETRITTSRERNVTTRTDEETLTKTTRVMCHQGIMRMTTEGTVTGAEGVTAGIGASIEHIAHSEWIVLAARGSSNLE